MNAPLIIQDGVLREVLRRDIARHEANELRAWRRRYRPARVNRLTRVLIPLMIIAWGIAAFVVLAAAFEL